MIYLFAKAAVYMTLLCDPIRWEHDGSYSTWDEPGCHMVFHDTGLLAIWPKSTMGSPGPGRVPTMWIRSPFLNLCYSTGRKCL